MGTPLPQQQQHGPDAAPARRRGPGRRPDPRAAPGRRHPALRTDSRRTERADLPRPEGRGDPLAGRRLLLRAEQLQPRDPGQAPAGLQFQAVHLQRGPGQRFHRRQPGQRCADRVRRRVPGQGLATEERHQHLPRPDPAARSPVQVPQHGLDPRPAGPGHRAGDQLHHQVRLPARRTAAQLLPGPGYRDSHTDGNRRRLERIRQRRLQGQSVRHRTHREPRRTGAVPGQSAPRAGGRTGRCAGCGRRRESWRPRASGERRRRRFDRSPASRRQGPDHLRADPG